MKYLTPALVAAMSLLASAAEARPHHYHHYAHKRLPVPVQTGYVDVASIPPYPFEAPRAISRPAGHYSPTYGAYADYHANYGGGLSAPCRLAAREGGPCGCHTAEALLGTSEHVYHGVNVWLAADWLRYRHVAAAPGMAAVFLGRSRAYHVAPVESVNGDGTVTVADYFGSHRVRTANLVFVDPHSR